MERAVLGVCMLERDAFGKIYSIVDRECFYHEGHQLVFDAIREMYTGGSQIDILTVVDHLVRLKGHHQITGVNTGYFVAELTNHVVSGAHVEFHSNILKSMWMEREIIKLTHGGTKMDGSTRQKLYDIQAKVQAIQSRTNETDWTDMSTLMVELYRHQEMMRQTGGVGLLTGLPTIDRKTGGLHPGHMVVVGARPSVGKSAFIGGIAMNMAKAGKTVGFLSLEMRNVELAGRLAAIDTQTDFNVLFRAMYRDEREMHAVYERIANHTAGLPIYVSDKTDVNITEIKAKAQKLKSMHGLDCLIIDYLQLIDAPEGFNRSREQEISRISRGCKIMAMEMEIPVVLLCQLNREVTKRKGEERYPQLSDIRESGSIEQDADVVLFLHRDYMTGITQDEHGNSTEFQADLVVRKWRNCDTNYTVPMDFDGPKMLFTERRDQTFGFRPVKVAEVLSDDNPF